MNYIIPLLLLLFTKHLVVDWLYQPPWMYKNKGTYGRLGGIVHAALHGIVTLLILLRFVTIDLALNIAVLESITHYHIDWAKMNISRMMDWGPTTSENFWRLTGVDQWLHALCYIGIVWWVFA